MTFSGHPGLNLKWRPSRRSCASPHRSSERTCRASTTERARAWMRPRAAAWRWMCGAGVAADAGAVDALARLELAARRHGCRVRILGAGQDLIELIDLIGLRQA